MARIQPGRWRPPTIGDKNHLVISTQGTVQCLDQRGRPEALKSLRFCFLSDQSFAQGKRSKASERIPLAAPKNLK